MSVRVRTVVFCTAVLLAAFSQPCGVSSDATVAVLLTTPFVTPVIVMVTRTVEPDVSLERLHVTVPPNAPTAGCVGHEPDPITALAKLNPVAGRLSVITTFSASDETMLCTVSVYVIVRDGHGIGTVDVRDREIERGDAHGRRDLRLIIRLRGRRRLGGRRGDAGHVRDRRALQRVCRLDDDRHRSLRAVVHRAQLRVATGSSS